MLDKPRPSSADLEDLVQAIASEVACDAAKSFNAFCIVYRVSWDEQVAIRGHLSDASSAYYNGLDSGQIDVALIREALDRLELTLMREFDWPEKVLLELLQACSNVGMLRGFCATALEIKKELLLRKTRSSQPPISR